MGTKFKAARDLEPGDRLIVERNGVCTHELVTATRQHLPWDDFEITTRKTGVETATVVFDGCAMVEVLEVST